jgi:CheY-like chemotaxis protein
MNKQVLLIDDDPIFHVIFTRMIKSVSSGLSVNSFANGEIGLEYLNKNYSVDDQYVILLDINMPIINGWQFLDVLRKKGIAFNNNIYIYILTSSTDLDDVKQSRTYNFVKDIISKPLTVSSLTSVLKPLTKE